MADYDFITPVIVSVVIVMGAIAIGSTTIAFFIGKYMAG